jgi:hypothetical protein
VVDEVQTALEGESPMLREVQDDGLAVDAEADVFDCVSVGLTGRCYWYRFRTCYRYIPVHSLLAGGSVTPAPLSGAINTTSPELSLSYNRSADLLYEGGAAQTISCWSNPCKHGSPER